MQRGWSARWERLNDASSARCVRVDAVHLAHARKAGRSSGASPGAQLEELSWVVVVLTGRMIHDA
jgi:hypothetical protein